MKSFALLTLFFAGMFLTAKASPYEEVYTNLQGIVQQVAGEYKDQLRHFMAQPMGVQNLTEILIGFGGGFLSGLFTSSGHGDGARCFENFKNLTEVYRYVQYIISHGLEKDPVKMTRQLLVLGVMILNVTIEEWMYCRDVGYVYTTFYGTLGCILRCHEYYAGYVGENLLKRSYDYFYYFKESIREFFNADYHYSGFWMAHAANSLVLVNHTSCYGTYCPGEYHIPE